MCTILCVRNYKQSCICILGSCSKLGINVHKRLEMDISRIKDKELSIKHMPFQLLHVKKTMMINMKAEKKKDYLILNDIFQYSRNPCQSLNLLFHFTHMS